MTERPRFFDDLAGVAGGAFSALAGMREEAEGMIKARVDEAIRRFDLVKREDLEAVQEMAAAARAGQEAAEVRLAALEARVAGMGVGAVVSTAVPADAGVSGTEAPPSGMPGGVGEGGMPPVPPSID